MSIEMDKILAETEQAVRQQQEAIYESYRKAAEQALRIPDERKRQERIAEIDRDCRDLCQKVAKPLADLLNIYVPPMIVSDPSKLDTRLITTALEADKGRKG